MVTHNSTGVRADGTVWSSLLNINGGWGATRDGDADGAQNPTTANYADLPVEALERAIPALIMRREYLPDTGGAGRFRGGAGSATDAYYFDASESYVSVNHIRSAPGTGALGGLDGTSDALWAWEPDSAGELKPDYLPVVDEALYASSIPVAGRLDTETLRQSPTGKFFHWGSRPVWAMPPGATWRCISAGGGGWGDPLKREPAVVLRDVRDGYVSVEGAARDYGVVVVGDPDTDPEGLRLDESATAEARERLHGRTPEHVEPALEGADYAPAVDPVERQPVDGTCPECGGTDLARYEVVAHGGWMIVVKCQACLASISRERWRRLGSLPVIEDFISAG
jgi:N-methylhydantoinase B